MVVIVCFVSFLFRLALLQGDGSSVEHLSFSSVFSLHLDSCIFFSLFHLIYLSNYKYGNSSGRNAAHNLDLVKYPAEKESFSL